MPNLKVLYGLELTKEELDALWALLILLDCGSIGLDRIETAILDKVQRLMEGR